jgi:hypothetical protein
MRERLTVRTRSICWPPIAEVTSLLRLAFLRSARAINFSWRSSAE